MRLTIPSHRQRGYTAKGIGRQAGRDSAAGAGVVLDTAYVNTTHTHALPAFSYPFLDAHVLSHLLLDDGSNTFTLTPHFLSVSASRRQVKKEEE